MSSNTDDQPSGPEPRPELGRPGDPHGMLAPPTPHHPDCPFNGLPGADPDANLCPYERSLQAAEQRGYDKAVAEGGPQLSHQRSADLSYALEKVRSAAGGPCSGHCACATRVNEALAKN